MSNFKDQTGISPLETKKTVLCSTLAALRRLQTFLDAASGKKKKVAARLLTLVVGEFGDHRPKVSRRDRVSHASHAGLVLGSRCRGEGQIRPGSRFREVSPKLFFFLSARATDGMLARGRRFFWGLFHRRGSSRTARGTGARGSETKELCTSSPRFD